MGRSGYSDDCDEWALIRWRGAVASSIRGSRGQAFLKEMLSALDNLPEKRLIKGKLASTSGEVCALGSVGLYRGMDLEKLQNFEVDFREKVASLFNIPDALAGEIQFINDDDFSYDQETPEKRFERVRAWIVENIKEPK